MINLLQQIKNRRLALKLKQNDMPMRIGISRQQYKRLETKSNPRLDILELIAQGLNSDIMLIPKEKLNAVLAVLKVMETTHLYRTNSLITLMNKKGYRMLHGKGY